MPLWEPVMPRLRPLSRLMPRSLRAKLLLGVVVPLTCVLSILVIIEHRRHHTADLQHLSLLAAHSAEVIRANFNHHMVEGDVVGLDMLMNSMTENKNFRILYLLNSAGELVFVPDDGVASKSMDNAQPGCQPCHRLPADQRPQSIVVTAEDGTRVFRTMLPIENSPSCTGCHGAQQRLLGALLADISMAPLEVPMAASFQINLLWSAGMILITVVSIVFATNRLVIERLDPVVQTLRRFGWGERGLRLQVTGADEIATLGKAFSDMADNIATQEAANRALSEDVKRHAERRRKLLKKLIVAQEEERKRVARDLHDELGQGLAGLAVSLVNMERSLPGQPEALRSQIEQARAQITTMADRMRDMVLDLRPSALDHLGLLPALRGYAEPILKDAGIALDVTSDMPDRLPMEVEIAVFRTVQEALTNVVRHARASRVRICLTVTDGMFEGECVDDGRGFDVDKVYPGEASNGSFGLLGMNERVELCDGTLTVMSRPGAGTRIQIHIPLPGAPRD